MMIFASPIEKKESCFYSYIVCLGDPPFKGLPTRLGNPGLPVIGLRYNYKFTNCHIPPVWEIENQ